MPKYKRKDCPKLFWFKQHLSRNKTVCKECYGEAHQVEFKEYGAVWVHKYHDK